MHTPSRLPSKAESERIAKSLSPTERMVYYHLVGNLHHFTYKAEVARLCHIPGSTVHDIAEKLEECRAIRRFGSKNRPILYEKGVNCSIVDEYVKLDLEKGLYSETGYDHVVTGASLDQKIHFLRTHLSGGWMFVNVLQEGVLKGFRTKDIYVTLFGDAPLKDGMKGMLDVIEKVEINGAWVRVRYMKGKKTATKRFGICPSHLLLTEDAIQQSTEDLLKLFFSSVQPFFQSLERFGGWIFEKNDCGDYRFSCKAVPEFGFDGDISAIYRDVLNGQIGVVGQDSLFYDRSDPAGPEGEMETRSVSIAHAVQNLDKYAAMTDDNNERLNTLEKQCNRLEQKYDDLEKRVSPSAKGDKS